MYPVTSIEERALAVNLIKILRKIKKDEVSSVNNKSDLSDTKVLNSTLLPGL